MYKPVQKKSSSWTPASSQSKSKSLTKPGTFSVQPKPERKSSQQQEIPDYSSKAADALAANVMRNLETQKPEQEEAKSVQRQLNLGAAFVVDGVTPIAQSPTASIQSKEAGIQRQCSECAKEQQEQSAEEGKDSDEMSLGVGVQTKLTVGTPGDKYEQEADQVAAQVMSMSVTPDSSPQVQRFGEEDNLVQRWSLAQSITPVVQRQVDEQVQMRQLVQRAFQAGGNEASGDLESRLNTSKGGGSALAPEVRSFMEPRFGADFSQVRVHTGSESVQMNQDLNAQAFTHQQDVYFGAGKAPGNDALTAHELTHVVQQTGVVQRKCNLCDARETKIGEEQIQAKQSIDQIPTLIHQGSLLQRVHIENGRKKFDNSDYIGDPKLEACLNDEDRLRPFETGTSVATVQRGLQKDGMDLGVDGTRGVYGADTGKAVKEFKRKHSLGFTQFPDVGPGTMTKLDELGNKKPEECPPCPTSTSLPPNCPPCPPILPEPPEPDVPPGPVKPPGSVFEFCVPFLDKKEAFAVHPLVTALAVSFAGKFGSEVQNLYLAYMTNPKSGRKGTLPPRQVFGNQQSRVVKEFRQDPETQEHKNLIMKLLADGIRSNSALMPLPGQSTPLLDFRSVLDDKELSDRQMSFGDPANRIPGFIAGGPAKGVEASDAGDDVRKVDGKFIATNLGSFGIHIRAAFIFDVFDCVDFCPGNSGSGLALGLTIPMSKLEATPDVPTYDVPFEVVYGLSDEQSF